MFHAIIYPFKINNVFIKSRFIYKIEHVINNKLILQVNKIRTERVNKF